MAWASTPSPSLRREEVLANGSAGVRLPESCGLVAGGDPRFWGRIGATAGRTLRQRMESELRLAGTEQTMLRRAALRRLLEDEHRQHQRELHQRGKAFYVERL